MSVNKFMIKLNEIKDTYEDGLMEIRYSLLENPKNNEMKVKLLEILNEASNHVISCMEIANSLNKPEARRKCMDIIEDFLPEYFYLLQEEKNFVKRAERDTPPKRQN